MNSSLFLLIPISDLRLMFTLRYRIPVCTMKPSFHKGSINIQVPIMDMIRLFVCFPEVFWWKGTSQKFQMAMTALPLNLRRTSKPRTANSLTYFLSIKNSITITNFTGVYRKINKEKWKYSVQCLVH